MSNALHAVRTSEYPPPAEAAPARPRILIVDDHALLRFGLRTMLMADRVDIEIDEAASLQDAIDGYRERPAIDLVLLDLNMGDCRGLQGLRRFREVFPQARVAVLSATHDEFVVRQAQALGAVANIAKSSQPARMCEVVLSLICAPATASGSGSVAAPRSASYDRVAELGARHLEILDLVLFGCSNQEISTATRLSLGTVKNYVSTILLALDVRSRSHLISLFR